MEIEAYVCLKKYIDYEQIGEVIMCLSPKEMMELYISGCKKKVSMSVGNVIGKSILAGMMIAMGAAGSSVAAHAITNVGLSRLTAAVVFPVGLMMVILLGAELFTGDCLMAVALPDKHITVAQFIKMLVLVYIGNFIGAFLLSALAYFSGQFDYSGGLLGAYTIKVAMGKAVITPIKAISSGILCNILVCAAVLMALCAKDVTGKLLASFFVIMLFVTSGYEHCVANMYYITAGLFAKMNPNYVAVAMSEYNLSDAQIAALNVKNMLITNLIPVTIGNIIGGSVCIGLSVYFLCGAHAGKKNA